LEVTIHMLPHLNCITNVSVRSSLPCINTGVRIELALSFCESESESVEKRLITQCSALNFKDNTSILMC